MKATVFFHEAELQGAGIALERVFPRLRAHGWELDAWFPYQGPLIERIAPHVEDWRWAQGVFAFSVAGWRRPPGPLARVRRLPRYAQRVGAGLRASPDVVHANTLLSLPEATIAKLLGYPVVFHVHELPPPSRKRDLTLRWVAWVADVIVAVSSAVEDMLVPYARGTPVRRVYNGLPFEALEGVHRAEGGGRFVMGTIGALSSRKGGDVFLDAGRLAIAERDDIDVLHVGPPPWGGDAGFAEVVEGRMATLPADRVRLAGVLDAREALAAMDVFVMASRADPFPLASLEAMAVRLPVIASDVDGLAEQIEHPTSGILVPPGDPRAIADWVVRLRDDPALRREIGERGHEHVSTRFTLDAQADGIDDAWRTALRLAAG